MSTFQDAVCPICSGKDFNSKYQITYYNDDILPKIGVVPPYPNSYLCVCKNCNHHFTSPQLSDESLDLYYSKVNSEYYTSIDYLHDKLLKQHKAVLALVEQYKQGGSLLEIGCGNGYLLSLFKAKKWDVIGVEPFEKACEFAQKKLHLNVIHGYLNETTFPFGYKFDVIMLFDVVEHLKNASDMKRLIDFYLKPGGLLVIGTGDISSFNAKISAEKWAYLTLREHVSFYSKNSMAYWLKPYSLLKIRNISYHGSWLSNVKTLFINLLFRRLYNFIQRLLYPYTNFTLTRFPFVRYMLTFDHMIVIASKPK